MKECLQCQDGRKLSGLQSDMFLPAATATAAAAATAPAAALVIDLPDFHGPPADEKRVSCGTVNRERGRVFQGGRAKARRGRATRSAALTLNLPGVELSVAPCRSC